MADLERDEVFAKIMRLVPLMIRNNETDYDDDGNNGSDVQEKKPASSFAKTLTQSDANNNKGTGGCAETTIFPPRLDYSAESPVVLQTVLLLAKDVVHGEIWNFRHIYSGTPRWRHLLRTAGWSSTFVNQKKLIAGDSKQATEGIFKATHPLCDEQLLAAHDVGCLRVATVPIDHHLPLLIDAQLADQSYHLLRFYAASHHHHRPGSPWRLLQYAAAMIIFMITGLCTAVVAQPAPEPAGFHWPRGADGNVAYRPWDLPADGHHHHLPSWAVGVIIAALSIIILAGGIGWWRVRARGERGQQQQQVNQPPGEIEIPVGQHWGVPEDQPPMGPDWGDHMAEDEEDWGGIPEDQPQPQPPVQDNWSMELAGPSDPDQDGSSSSSSNNNN